MDKDLVDEQTEENIIDNKENDDETDNVIENEISDSDNESESDTDSYDVNDNLQANQVIGQQFITSDDEDEDDEDNEDDNYLQKFDEASQQKIISEFHPELLSHNYHEIEILSRVVRDEKGQIIDPLHKTLPFITRYEKARILGERAKQINAGGKPLVEIDSTVIDGYLISLKEFEEKKIPFILKRPLPNGGCEYWKFSDLEILT